MHLLYSIYLYARNTHSSEDCIMPPKAKATAKKARAPKAHKLSDPLPMGEELTDIIKGKWRVGKPVGQGGFGLLYLASRASDSLKSDPQYVVKVEPVSNGALFSELSFYQRVAKSDLIKQWVSTKRLKSFGMPEYVASGKHDRGKENYRFMIMDRYDCDLQKKFMECGKRFSHKTILTLAIQILDVLEYIHSREYAHADIKASNLLLGYGKSKVNQAYLVDYGLAYKFSIDGKPKEYKEDPKRCHDGTIEFTSIDAHKGVCPSPRGDLEILGYCILQWFCSKLPWENKLTDPNYVRDQKIKSMNNIPAFMKDCFGAKAIPDEVQKFLEYVKRLKYDEKPDYPKCRKIFIDAFVKHGLKDDNKLEFSKGASTPAKTPRAKKRKNQSMHNISQTSFDVSFSEPEASPTPPKRGRKSADNTRALDLKKAKGARVKSSPVKIPKSATPSKRTKTPPAPKGVKRVLSPSNSSTGISPARQRVKSTPKRATTPRRTATPQNINQNNAAPSGRGRVAKIKTHVGTQTSPGLKGLKRSRKKRA